MANQLFPTFEVPGAVVEEPVKNSQYRKGPLFDIEKGDFVLNGANQLIYGNGYESWVLWCTKTVMTQRGAHLAYGMNAGIDLLEAMRESDKKATRSMLERTITEALMADPMGRTANVRNYKFSGESDELYVTCEVVGVDGNSATIQARL